MPEVIARPSLVPLVSSIRPGGAFWLALRLEIHPGYRVSWTYAGDVGREIRVRFAAPDGFEVGRVVYPAPQRFTVGTYEAFGWQERTAAFVEIKPPRRLSTSDAYRFDVDGDWLACKKECLRESIKAYLELTASWSGGQSIGDEDLEALLEQVPKSFADEKAAKHEWNREARAPSVRLTIDGVKLSEFIPASHEARKAVTVKVLDRGDILALEYDVPPGPPPHTTHGILLGQRGSQPASYEVEIPWIDVQDDGEKK
jgi:hypothetical protein